MANGSSGDLVGRPAHELAALVQGGEVSARQVVLAHLERVEAVNAGLNAIVTLRAEEALAEADRVDAAVAAEEDLPLAGVPFTVKDIIAAAGVRLTAGTPFMGDFVPRRTPPPSADCGRPERSCWARPTAPSSACSATRGTPASERRRTRWGR